MESSIEEAASEQRDSRSFPKASREFSKVQQTLQSVPPRKDKVSLVEPVTQTATVSTVVTTINPTVARLPVEEELASTVSGSTLQTTVVTTVGNTSVASSAAGTAAVSIAATGQEREPVDGCSIPSSSAVQDALLQSVEKPVSSTQSTASPPAKVLLPRETKYARDKDDIERENQQLREVVEDIQRKREKFLLLTDKMEREVKRQLQLINKYRSLLISTFENRPIYIFQQIVERMKMYAPASTSTCAEKLSNLSGFEERSQRMPSVSHNLKSTASAEASVKASNFRATAASSSAVNMRYIEKEWRESDSSPAAYLERPLAGNVQSQEKTDRKDKGNEDNWHTLGGGKGRSNLWTPKEDALFMKAFKQYGTKWKQIQKVLPNKSRRQIQSHGAYLLRLGKLNKELIRSGNKQLNSWHDEQEYNDDSKQFINTYESDDV
ncbi:hypothetical protein GpartN1_g1504.t1 [Galdieria partita]|uniref:Uncharacterized protein n=1 Tax=Galdieria partita TaxID=83374 RepID=A0A9C7UND1_9RHOD|nr:hypothetical protein GpartN1_g1504.t1 [Galdieria partita]